MNTPENAKCAYEFLLNKRTKSVSTNANDGPFPATPPPLPPTHPDTCNYSDEYQRNGHGGVFNFASF